MKIEYFGHSCFRLTNEKGVAVLTDPYTKVGYELPNGLKTNIVTISHSHFDHNHTAALSGAYEAVNSEGCHEKQGISIEGVKSWHDPKQGALRGENIIFCMEIDGLKVCHFGDLGEEYSEKFDEILGGADIFLIPVGGTYTIDAGQAKEYIERLQPKCVIPMHYLPEDGRLDIAPIDSFLNLFNETEILHAPNGVMEINKDTLNGWGKKILYMERKRV